MRNILLVSLFIILIGISFVSAENLLAGKDYVGGELVIGFNEGTSKNQAKGLILEFGLTLKDVSGLENLDTVVIEVPIGEEQVWIERFENTNIVSYVKLNDLTPPTTFSEEVVESNYTPYYIIGAVILIILVALYLKKKK